MEDGLIDLGGKFTLYDHHTDISINYLSSWNSENGLIASMY